MYDYKTINLFLLFSIIIFVGLLYLIGRKNETFEDMDSSMNNTKTDENENKNENEKNDDIIKEEGFDYSIETMFKNLEKAENYCDDMDRRQEKRENEDQLKINKIAKQQFENQQIKINELKSIIEYLKKEQLKRESISQKCRANTQFNMNKDLKTAKKLAEMGLLNKDKTVVNMNVSKSLKQMLDPNVLSGKGKNSSSSQPRYMYNQCPDIDKTKYIHISDLANKCVGCDPKKIIEQAKYIHRDFK